MKSRIAFFSSTIFLLAYSLASTIGSVFLVTWGSPSWFKSTMIFLGSFPIDWNKLIVERGIVFLLLNCLFWSILVYLLVLAIEKLFARFQGKNL
jgi:hypothetical protein